MKKPVIGILGGMGPRATVQFEQLLLDRLPGTDQQLPTIMTINDGSIPDRSNFIVGDGDDPLPQMQRNLTLLEGLGASIVCIPCNTACVPDIFDRLQPVRSRILNLPQQVSKAMARQGLRRVMLLATAGTVRSQTYQTVCREYGITCAVPDAQAQQQVTDVITAVKCGDLDRAASLAAHVAAAVVKHDAEAVILGCTELPLVREALTPDGWLAVDTLAVLAERCVYTLKRITQEES